MVSCLLIDEKAHQRVDEEKLIGLDVGKILPVYFVYRDDVLVKRFVGEKTIDELEREIHAD